MDELLLDTDMLSEAGRATNPNVRRHVSNYLSHHSGFTFSSITKYQVLRGLRLKGARRQLGHFARTCAHARIIPIGDAEIGRAAELWADAKKGGKPSEDADLLIAATALEHNLSLCTGNTTHFDWITGLKLVNWRLP